MDLAFAWSTLLALVHGIPLTLLLALPRRSSGSCWPSLSP